MSSPSELSDRVRDAARVLGFTLVGVAAPDPSEHGAFYRDWLARGRHGEMAYLARPDAVARREDLRGTMPDVRSVVVVGLEYGAGSTGPEGDPAADPSRGVIARYARGRDYHKPMKKRLLALLDRIGAAAGRPVTGRAYVDTGPILERELARRAGLGWYGRNTLLIHPRRGSWFLLGVLLLDLELEPDAPFTADRCGTCARCVAACPTGALLGRDAGGAPVIDATRCISYLTIEQRGPIPRELRAAIGNRVFGCDICQEVCPFNARFGEEGSEPAFAARAPGEAPVGVEPRSGRSGSAATHPGTVAPSLIDLMRMSPEEWEAFSRGSAIRRAGYAGLKRNVAVALGNWLAGVEEPPEAAVAVLREALEDADPVVREHAGWALEQACRGRRR